MNSYVVRIYWRNNDSPQNLVGLVELIDCGKEKAFASFEELRAILNNEQEQAACKAARHLPLPQTEKHLR